MKAIRARRVFDGETMVAGANTLLVEGNCIIGMAACGMVPLVGCDVVDFPDATLLPGLIDTHVHLCGDGGLGALDRLPTFSGEMLTVVIEDSLRAHVAAGVTTVRDLGDRSWAVIEWRDRHRDDTTMPTILASGPPITSTGGHCWNMGGQARGVDELRHAVEQRRKRGVDIVKIMASGGVSTPGTDAFSPQFTVEELRVVVDAAHTAGLQVTAHAHPVAAIRDAIAAGVDAIEHATFVTETGIRVSEPLVASLVKCAIPVCPTLGTSPSVALPPASQNFLRRAGMTYATWVQTVGQLYEAGVRLVSGSDGGISPHRPHGALPQAVIDLVEGGVPTMQALASATAFAAQACGVGDRKGRLAPNFDADLLLVNGDPVADIAALRKPAAVYVRGRRAV